MDDERVISDTPAYYHQKGASPTISRPAAQPEIAILFTETFIVIISNKIGRKDLFEA